MSKNLPDDTGFTSIINRGRWVYSIGSSSLSAECKPIFNKSKLDYQDICELLAFLCYGTTVRNSFFWSRPAETTEVLNMMTEKWKLQKKELTKIFSQINKQTNYSQVVGFSFKWVENCEKHGVIFVEDQIASLTKLGFVDSYNKFGSNFDQTRFNELFKNWQQVTHMMLRVEDFKIFYITRKFTLNINNILDALSFSSVSVYNSTQNYVDTLKFFEILGYVYTVDDIAHVIDSIKGQTCSLDNNSIRHIADNILIEIMNFFVERNIQPTYEILLYDTPFKNQSYYGCLNYKLLFLLNLGFIKPIEFNENQVLKFMLCGRSPLIKDKILVNAKIVFSAKLIKLFVILNTIDKLDSLMSTDELSKIDSDFLFKYACLNKNTKLAKYCLDNKFTPKSEHYMYIALSSISATTSGANDYQSHQSILTILNYIIAYGNAISRESYEWLAYKLSNYLILENFEKSILIDKKTMNDINEKILRASCETTKYLLMQTAGSSIYTTPEHYAHLGKCTIQNLINCLLEKKQSPSQQLCEGIVMYDYRNQILFEFLHDFFGYVPNLYTIMRIEHSTIRMIYLKRFYNIDYASPENTLNLTKNEMFETNTIRQNVEPNKADANINDNINDNIKDDLESDEKLVKIKKPKVVKAAKKATTSNKN